MLIRIGYDMMYNFPNATPVVFMLNVHPSRAGDLIVPDQMITSPLLHVDSYFDSFGNRCNRLLAPPGKLRVYAHGLIKDSGLREVSSKTQEQQAVEHLPAETLQYLVGSRYCDMEKLSDLAWNLFGHTPRGALRVQAICDWVHEYLTFGYQHACSMRTAWDAYQEKKGVCRDFAHLAISFCRCLNIPARYCTGYLGDIGELVPDEPMDFAAWLEAYIDGQWHTFDPRNNKSRIGRILIARGRDAADTAISYTFGSSYLESFKVVTEEEPEEDATDMLAKLARKSASKLAKRK